MIALALAVLLFVADVSSISVKMEDKEENTWSKEVKQSEEESPAALKFVSKFDTLMEEFNCATKLKAPDCEAWRALNLIKDMDEKLNNCGQAAEHDWCKEATDLLGKQDEKLSHKRVMELLGQKVDALFDKEHGKEVAELYTALGDYICFKVPKICNVVREGMKTMTQWDKADSGQY